LGNLETTFALDHATFGYRQNSQFWR